MAKRFWLIRGYRGFDEIFSTQIPVGAMTESQCRELLRCLAAKENLSYEEIVGVYVKKKTRQSHELMAVTKNGPYPEYNCGHDPYFSAIVADENGERVKYPPLP